ncbi:MAG: hypothetical protein Q8P18_21390 [Pseudomonadota bacterium]|nr:hypothetical protein [Pseudomonadota bacterium]
MTRALWFHAFRRATIDEYFDVLVNGPAPAPLGIATSTKDNEVALGIAPPEHVYVYLSGTDTTGGFGEALFALALGDFDGTVTPFDTGGLVGHHAPAMGWDPPGRRSALVKSLSWPTAELAALLAIYPGPDDDAWASYIDGTRPIHAGPHSLWSCSEAACIWEDMANDWRAWTWEGRRPDRIESGAKIAFWTCSNAMLLQLQKWVTANPQHRAWLKQLMPKHIPDGVGELMAKHRKGEIP